MTKYVQISLKELFSVLSDKESNSLTGCVFYILVVPKMVYFRRIVS